jgi:hypothetical protein
MLSFPSGISVVLAFWGMGVGSAGVSRSTFSLLFLVLSSVLLLLVSGVVGRGLMPVWGVRLLVFGSLSGVPWCGYVVPGVTVVVVVVASGFVV